MNYNTNSPSRFEINAEACSHILQETVFQNLVRLSGDLGDQLWLLEYMAKEFVGSNERVDNPNDNALSSHAKREQAIEAIASEVEALIQQQQTELNTLISESLERHLMPQ